jgi:hypothetical protein
MLGLVDDFQDLSEKILAVSPPDKGECWFPMKSPFYCVYFEGGIAEILT